MADNIIPANLFKQLENSHSFYVIKVSVDGRYNYVNKAFAERFRFISSNLIGLPFELTVHPDDVDACLEATFAVISNPQKSVAIKLRKPDGFGGYFLTFYELSALFNDKGDITEILCIGYDINETEQAYQQARLSSESYNVIIENITDAFYILDRDWRFVKANAVFERMSGLSREKLLGKSIWDIIPFKDVQKLKTIYLQAVEANTSIRFAEYIEEVDKWLERTIYPSQEGLTVFVRDITERKLAEEKVREANNILIAALNSTSDLNILISPEYTILSFNKVAAEFARTFFNRTISEGDSFWLYTPSGTEESFLRSINNAFTRITVEYKQQFNFAPGVELWYKLRFYPVLDADNRLIGVAFNATNIDKEQRQLENLEEIASLYSQEIRKPVATIMGITKLINEETLNPSNKKWFGYLIKTTQELDGVINRIVKKSSEI